MSSTTWVRSSGNSCYMWEHPTPHTPSHPTHPHTPHTLTPHTPHTLTPHTHTQEGSGPRVVSAFVEIIFDNSDGRIPVSATITSVNSMKYLVDTGWERWGIYTKGGGCQEGLVLYGQETCHVRHNGGVCVCMCWLCSAVNLMSWICWRVQASPVAIPTTLSSKERYVHTPPHLTHPHTPSPHTSHTRSTNWPLPRTLSVWSYYEKWLALECTMNARKRAKPSSKKQVRVVWVWLV